MARYERVVKNGDYPDGGFGARQCIKTELYCRRHARKKMLDARVRLKNKTLTKAQRERATMDAHFGSLDFEKHSKWAQEQLEFVKTYREQEQLRNSREWLVGG